jgi:ubiquitin-like 1-activating enzyme E1 B
MIKPSKLEMIYGAEVSKKVLSSNLLVVGAGGIGCELIKTLSITGFQKLTIVIIINQQK